MEKADIFQYTKIPAQNQQKKNAYLQIIEGRIDERLKAARQFFRSGEIEKSISEYQKVIFLQPNTSDVYKELGEVYIEINDISAAIMLLKKANTLSYSIMLEEELKDLIFKKGLSLLEQGEYNNFLEGTQFETFGRTLQMNLTSIFEKKTENNKAHTFYLKACAYITTNHKNYAIDELDQALKQDPNYLQAILLKGKIFWSQLKIPEGNDMFWRAEGISPDNQEVQDFLKMIIPKADELLRETRFLLVQNQLDLSLINIKRGLELFPNNTQFLLIKAFICRKKGEYEQALNNLYIALHKLRDLRLEPEVKNQISLTYNEMGIVLYNREEYDQAITLFNESVINKPSDWSVYVNRGDCYRQLGRIDEALQDYLQAQKNIGDKEDVNNRISIIRNSKGVQFFNARQYQKALEQFDDAIRLNNNVANYYQNRGKCWLEMQQISEAISDFMRSHELDPKNYEVATLVQKLKQESLNKKQTKIINLNKDDI